MNVDRSRGDHDTLEGDIVVTAVAKHYALSRVQGPGVVHEYLGMAMNRAVALKRACALAGAEHRVFLYPSADRARHTLFDCARDG